MKLSLDVLPEKIMVATDLTDQETLYPHVVAQSRENGAKIFLIHVSASYESVPADAHTDGLNKFSEFATHEALKTFASRLEDAGVNCVCIVRSGLAQEAICTEIEYRSCTRLIIGTHSHGFAGQSMLGSVADALLRRVAVPVFVVGPHSRTEEEPRIAPQKLFHPVSLKGNYREHARFAVELAHAIHAELTFLHVLPHYMSKSSYSEELVVQAEAALTALVPPELASELVVRPVITCGNLVREIIATSTAVRASLIVLEIKRDFPFWSKSNSAAYQVLAEAICPLMLVRDTLSEDVGSEDTRHNSTQSALASIR